MKNALIITYYWPPSGGIEVQRVVKFCKYLPEFGWNPVILTVNNGNFNTLDKTFTQEVEHVSQVYKANSIEPHSLFNGITKLFSKQKKHPANGASTKKNSQTLSLLAEHIRLNLFIPDSRIGWYFNAIKEGSRAIEETKPEIIFSTSPPYTVHLVARHLKMKYKLPWIVDFRDPWLENTAYNTVPRLGIVKQINKKLEHRTLNDADRVITVGNGMRDLLKEKMIAPEKLSIVSNGYDHIENNTSSENKDSDYFYISYYGSLYWRRFPEQLFNVISSLCDTIPEFSEHFRFRYIGQCDDRVGNFLRSHVPADKLEISAYVDHKELPEMLSEPQLLLLSIDQVPSQKLIVTGKIFDYITTGNPILGIGPLDGDAAILLENTNTGTMFSYNDTEGLKHYVLDAFQKWKTGQLKTQQKRFHEFERKSLTKNLAGIMNELCP